MQAVHGAKTVRRVQLNNQKELPKVMKSERKPTTNATAVCLNVSYIEQQQQLQSQLRGRNE